MRKAIIILCLLAMHVISAAEFQVKERPEDMPDWAYRPGSHVVWSCKGDVESAITITRWGEETFRRIETRPGEPGELLFNVPTDENGLFDVRCGNDTRRYAVIPQPPEHDSFDNCFGVNFHLERISTKDAAREIAYAQFIGIDWGRGIMQDFQNMGSPDFENENKRWEPLLALIEGSGLNLLGGIYYFSQYASGAPDQPYIVYSRTMQDDTSEITRYAEFISAKCPFVTYWEIGNEPDADLFWKGRLKNLGNHEAMAQDYTDFLAAAAKGIRKGNPNAKLLYCGITSGAPYHSHYRNFFENTLKDGALDIIDIMNTHYGADVSAMNRLIAEYSDKTFDIWITEAGGTSSDSLAIDEIRQARADVLGALEQLADGCVKIFKYDMRNDGTNPAEKEDNFGFITRDFEPKASYVSYATLIRECIGFTNLRRLNVTYASDRGWLKAFAWTQGGIPKAAFVLEAADTATVTLATSDDFITVTDMFGESHDVPAEDGRVVFEIGRGPLFISGHIQEDEGAVAYPKPVKLGVFFGHLHNPRFADGLAHWSTPLTAIASLGTDEKGLHLDIPAPGPQNFTGIGTSVNQDLAAIRATLAPGQFLRVRTKAHLATNLTGRGISLSADQFNGPAKPRISRCETGFETGEQQLFAMGVDSGTIHDEATSMSLVFYVAPSTYGTIDIQDVAVFTEVWQNPLFGTERKMALALPPPLECDVENAHLTDNLHGWHPVMATGAASLTHVREDGNGFLNVKIPAPGMDSFSPIIIPVKTRLDDARGQRGDSLSFLMSITMRIECTGRGVAPALEFLDGDGTRVKLQEMPYIFDCPEWETFLLAGAVPENAVSMRIVITFAPATYGSFDIDEASLILK